MIWVTLIGSWLLFAGSLQQAVHELHAESIEHERLQREHKSVSRHSRIPAWMWLVPPVASFVHRRQVNEFQRSYFHALDEKHRRKLVSFLNRATSWGYLGSGAWLIALSETYDIVDSHNWRHVWFFIIVIASSFIASFGAFERIRRSETLINSTGK